MKVIISGGSGFVGEAIASRLVEENDVVILSRDPSRVSVGRGLEWDGESVGEWAREIDDAEAIINLAGASIASGRWTEKKKKLLRSSRISSTRALVEAIRNRSSSHPIRFLSASATGYYGDRGDDVLDEDSHPGEGFLAGLAVDWETEAKKVGEAAELWLMRFGIVIGEGGLVARLRPLFRMFLGGRLGSGAQYMPWIDLVDLVSLVQWLLAGRGEPGIYNFVSPHPVTNEEFTRQFAASLNRPTSVPAPAFALKLIMGEMADEMLLASARVLPRHAQAAGFSFQHPHLTESLYRINRS